MFVLFGIDLRTGKPERVTQHESRSALRRMWMTYPSAAIGDLDGDADDVEVKPGTDRVRAVALSRAIVQAQRAHQRDEAAVDDEPAEDRDAKPENVSEPAPAPVEPPAEDNEPEDDPAPPASDAPRDATVNRTVKPAAPPLRRLPCARVPCPVPGCDDLSAPFLNVLPEPLRVLCKMHRDNAQAYRSKGQTIPAAIETVMHAARARIARESARAASTPASEAPVPRTELANEPPKELLVRSSAPLVDTTFAQVLRMDRDPPPIGSIDGATLAPIFDRLDAVAAAATVPTTDALTRADFAAVLRGVRDALDVAIARLESPR